MRVAWNKGKKLTKKHRLKLSKAKIGKTAEKSNGWKGDKAGYFAFHLRVNKIRGRIKYCEKCKTEDKNKQYEWANISGHYANIMDYKRLCQSCHRKEDFKKNGYRKYQKRKKKI